VRTFIAIGNPLGLDQTVHARDRERAQPAAAGHAVLAAGTADQTDAPINPATRRTVAQPLRRW